jgi:hypothetical protein
MILRGPSTCEDTECVFPSDLKLLLHFDSAGLSFTKYPWSGNTYRAYATRGGGNPQALYGHGPDFGYFQFGAIWYGDEIWNGGRGERDYDGNGTISAAETNRYCLEELNGACWIDWTPGYHPTLGEIEGGGVNPKFWSQNGPPSVLERWAGNEAMFNIYMAKSLPKVEIASAVLQPVRAGTDSATHELRVTLLNSGMLPTALEQAKRIRIVQPDRLQIMSPQQSGVRVLTTVPAFWLEGNERREFVIRLQATGTQGSRQPITLRASSTRGGVAQTVVPW